jgi:hypothetical protein
MIEGLVIILMRPLIIVLALAKGMGRNRLTCGKSIGGDSEPRLDLGLRLTGTIHLYVGRYPVKMGVKRWKDQMGKYLPVHELSGWPTFD